MRRWWVAAAGLSMTLAACGPSGSGNVVSDQRDVGVFDSIEVSGGIALRLNVDPSATVSVTVNYDDNIIDLIVTEVDGTTLQIESKGTYNTIGGEDRYVEVTVPTLLGLTASGGADVIGQGALDVLDVNASGGANVDLALLPVGDVTLEASGGANIVVNVTDAITGTASGGADVSVQGDPPLQNIDVSGGADLSNG
ncbi:MAG TPA: DUF2807 domain-containing protein [Acidimicrobiia bacterium]